MSAWSSEVELANEAFRLAVKVVDREIHVRWHSLAMKQDLVDGPYLYRATKVCPEGTLACERVFDAAIEGGGEGLCITGRLAGLELQHTFRLPADRPIMEERLALHNAGPEVIALADLIAGLQRPIADALGRLLPEMADDHLLPIPFPHRPSLEPETGNDFGLRRLLIHTGREQRADTSQGYGYVPSSKRFAEGWAWLHGEHALGVFKFNQEALEFSVLSTVLTPTGVALCFGGAGMIAGDPSCLGHIEPGQTVELGLTRYVVVKGGYNSASYAFRGFLDEQGCRFPKDFDPPVHWNELYDNPEWSLASPGHPPGPHMTRPLTYTKALILQEAAKARDYHCQALYLDPGWDTDFATFLWGTEWLGDRAQFIAELKERYGLRLSLHTPLAPWLSQDGRGVSSWPREALRMDEQGRIIEGSVCLGSRQYLDEAARRLLDHCAAGVVFLMFDGNWWGGPCWNPSHGHPIPFTIEDHCRANLDLAQRIHARYPHVLIEMHDMVAGGATQRYTPVYYKYGLPGSYDENWGFELMWQPMEDILSGRARALYYYNLGCNVPIYLHIDLRDDNQHCLVLWWYASTCRHLGIGGTHADPLVAQAQRLAMQRYRQLERFYKRGEFYGLNEQVHIHALPEEGAFVVNLFNLSDAGRVIEGAVRVEELGLERNVWYTTPKGGGFDPMAGTFCFRCRLEPWDAQVLEVRKVG